MRFLESFKRVKEDGEREDDLYYVDQAKAFRILQGSLCLHMPLQIVVG